MSVASVIRAGLFMGILAAGLCTVSGCATAPVGAAKMTTGLSRYASVREITPEMATRCREKSFAPSAAAIKRFKHAGVRNYSVFLASMEGHSYLFSYLEYNGDDEDDLLEDLQECPAAKDWLMAVGGLPGQRLEEVFYCDGASDVVPTPGKFVRIGMITGLKPEKEAEYRTLHANVWPAVLEGIADCNYRDFSICVADCGGKLYLFGYLEYVGPDLAVDGPKGKALPINKRWWRFTDACQDPLPAAAAKKEIWDGMTELYHLE